MPTSSHIDISIYDASGRLVSTVAEGHRAAGIYSVTWDAGILPSGSYISHFTVDGYVETEKVIVLTR